MKPYRILAIVYLVFFIAMIATNYIVGDGVGNVADDNETLIQPAGYAFSIWGVIYISLFVWVFRMVLVKNSIDAMQTRLQYLPIINFILNGVWIVVFVNELVLISTIVIALLWLVTYLMYRIITKENYHWVDRLPISLYLGWLTFATVVNIFTVIDDSGFTYPQTFDESLVTTLALGAVAIFVIIFTMRNHDWIIPLVGVWTYTAILVDTQSPDTPFMLVIIVAIVLFIAVAVVNFLTAKKRYLSYRR